MTRKEAIEMLERAESLMADVASFVEDLPPINLLPGDTPTEWDEVDDEDREDLWDELENAQASCYEAIRCLR